MDYKYLDNAVKSIEYYLNVHTVMDILMVKKMHE